MSFQLLLMELSRPNTFFLPPTAALNRIGKTALDILSNLGVNAVLLFPKPIGQELPISSGKYWDVA